jgi:hypothetical protein
MVMTDTAANSPAPDPSQASVPQGLVSAVVNLVGTGPVLLGAYTIAELTAVDAVVDFLEARPSDEALTEAVQSLAARQLIVAGSPGEQVQGAGRPRHRGGVRTAGPDGLGRPRDRDASR